MGFMRPDNNFDASLRRRAMQVFIMAEKNKVLEKCGIIKQEYMPEISDTASGVSLVGEAF